jgi:sterol 3beta-glucosyltransferase
MIEESEEMDVQHPFEVQQPLAGISQDASRHGGGSLVLGSMALRGAGAQKRVSESAHRD